MLMRVLHLFCEYLLQRRQPPAGLLQFNEPRLPVGHTGDAVGHAPLRHAAELVRLAAQLLNALGEIRLYLFLCHAGQIRGQTFYRNPLASNFVTCMVGVQTMK